MSKRDQPLLLEALQQRVAELEASLAAKSAEIAAKDVRIREPEQLVVTLMAQVAALTRQVAELTEKLGQSSRNSHLPPSSDPPGPAVRARPAAASRGAAQTAAGPRATTHPAAGR